MLSTIETVCFVIQYLIEIFCCLLLHKARIGVQFRFMFAVKSFCFKDEYKSRIIGFGGGEYDVLMMLEAIYGDNTLFFNSVNGWVAGV